MFLQSSKSGPVCPVIPQFVNVWDVNEYSVSIIKFACPVALVIPESLYFSFKIVKVILLVGMGEEAGATGVILIKPCFLPSTSPGSGFAEAGFSNPSEIAAEPV